MLRLALPIFLFGQSDHKSPLYYFWSETKLRLLLNLDYFGQIAIYLVAILFSLKKSIDPMFSIQTYLEYFSFYHCLSYLRMSFININFPVVYTTTHSDLSSIHRSMLDVSKDGPEFAAYQQNRDQNQNSSSFFPFTNHQWSISWVDSLAWETIQP